MKTADSRLELCARLFHDPTCVVGTLTHEVRGAYIIAPHEHSDLLQFDLLVGCRGRAMVGDEWHPLNEVSAMVCPAGVVHGYELERRDRHLAGCIILSCDIRGKIQFSRRF